MLIPLTSHEDVMGILHLETKRENAFTQELFNFLKLVANRIGVAIENAQLYNIAQQQLEELQMLYSRVSSLEQLKSDMIRIAAHDLRNPLNVINTSIALIRRVTDEENRITYLDQLQSAANQMKRIISDILSLERIEQMQGSEGELLNLNEMAAAVASTFRMQAETKGQRLLLETADGNSAVQADPAQLREAVGNLLNNAIKYTPYDGLITIRVRKEDEMIILEVEDNGYGIPDDQQDKLFMPFQRAQSPETANIDGNGLGLYLIKNIVERFSGYTLFTSVYGEGSTFGFALPAVDSTG
jgi:signal transduction histidine kinase